MKKLLVLAFGVSFLGYSSPAFSLNITAMDSATGFANNLMGAGVTISNVTYSGANVASGYFSGGNADGLGIESGIVLTSGCASNLSGSVNNSDSITCNNSLGGDADLNTLIPGYTTHDATSLDFDFTTSSDSVYFNYAFGSDEYNEWVASSYNDVFGFFFNGTNIATLPDSSPVSIDTVNTSNNSSLYNNNDPSLGMPTPYGLEYDGFTDTLQASISGLITGTTYHIKLAIADAGDLVLDSGVFLQAGTFSDTPTPVPAPNVMSILGFGIAGLLYMARRQKAC